MIGSLTKDSVRVLSAVDVAVAVVVMVAWLLLAVALVAAVVVALAVVVVALAVEWVVECAVADSTDLLLPLLLLLPSLLLLLLLPLLARGISHDCLLSMRSSILSYPTNSLALSTPTPILSLSS